MKLKSISYLLLVLLLGFGFSSLAQEAPDTKADRAAAKAAKKAADKKTKTISEKEPKVKQPKTTAKKEPKVKQPKPVTTKAPKAASTDDPKVRKKDKGDKMYNVLGYKVSAEIYESLDLESGKDEEIMSHLANSYRLNGDLYNAELWYARFVKTDGRPVDILHYAEALLSNGKCMEAQSWFKIYDRVKSDSSDNRGKTLAIDCDELFNFKQNDAVKISKAEGINTDRLDFSPVYYADGIVFTSSRQNDKIQINTDKWTNQNFTDLYYAEKKPDGTFKKPTPLPGAVNGRFHDATATFTRAQDFMVFSRNNYVGAKRWKGDDGTVSLKVYTARKLETGWEEIEELAFNSDEYATCHPTITEDGKYMIFSSDRPGGYGGMDLYFSEFRGSNWGPPINLGALVNTAGNEIFPTWVNGALYFSSNGQKGLGGLDIFVARRAGNSFNQWSSVINLGKPFNSSRDDFGFASNEEGTEGYFTSSRDLNSNDDIYYWETIETLTESEKRVLCFKDIDSGEKIKGTTINIRDSKGIVALENYKDGQAFTVLPNEKYIIDAEKMGYHSVRKIVTSEELLSAGGLYCLELDKKLCAQLTGLVKSKQYNSRLPNAKVVLFNKCTGETEETVSTRDGSFEFCLECDCDYEISASKERFSVAAELLSTIDDCTEPLVANLLLDLVDQSAITSSIISQPANTVPAAVYPTQPNMQQPIYVDQQGRRIQPNVQQPIYVDQQGNPVQPGPQYIVVPQPITLNQAMAGNVTFAAGQIITLSPLYYNFDDARIRADAQAELDNVANLLLQYPSMEILLGSHTDSRGTDKYNKRLSQARADAAVRYLASKGISIDRMLAAGFGESKLLNECADGVECSEIDHQRNRRTEVKITKIDNRSGVQIDYVDKLPGGE